MIFLSLLNNIALLVSLSIVHSQIMRRWKQGTLVYQVLAGVLFGLVAVIGMMNPLRLLPGIIFDGRSIILSLAGLFGGPLTATIAALACAAYRLWLGGAGAGVGVSVICESAGLGVIFYYLVQRYPRLLKPLPLLVFGLLVHVGMLALMLFLPGGASDEVLRQISLPVLTVYPIATLLVGLLFLDQRARLQAEEELQKSEQLYRSLVEHLPQRIFVKDRRSVYVSCNANYARDLGITPEQIVGLEDFKFYPPELARQYRADDQRAMAAAEPLDVLEKYVAGGKEQWIHTVKVPYRDEAGQVIGVLGIFDDFTERKQAEDAIRDLNAELEKRVRERTSQLETTNQELEAFAYSISHDLRTPLRALDGYSRILSEDYAANLDDDGLRICAIIRENSQRMNQLIDNLLEFSRLSRVELRASDIDMTAMVQKVYNDLTTPDSRQRIDFQVNGLPAARGDPALLRQVWVNLLANAIKFSGRRERAEITVSSRQDGQEGVYIIRDNGVGFDPLHADNLFGVFQRLQTAQGFEGSGAGLAIVQRIVHRHGGRVWAEGAVDQGATFYFSLPVP